MRAVVEFRNLSGGIHEIVVPIKDGSNSFWHFFMIKIYDYFTGQDFTAAQRERAQEDFKVLFEGAVEWIECKNVRQ